MMAFVMMICVHSGVDLPERYKIPKFETFNSNGNPMAHLRRNCDQIVGIGKNVALVMFLFNQCLSGEALDWFTSQELKKYCGWKALAKDFVNRFAYNVKIVPN